MERDQRGRDAGFVLKLLKNLPQLPLLPVGELIRPVLNDDLCLRIGLRELFRRTEQVRNQEHEKQKRIQQPGQDVRDAQSGVTGSDGLPVTVKVSGTVSLVQNIAVISLPVSVRDCRAKGARSSVGTSAVGSSAR